ncbi:flagellar brake protein [Halopseudomonas salegens]|uniref:C-di-GMP-binding flagellar brake protein YcgR, contains PilZNR and PilZ domains n=1 Tax=Halopseudomonas salegens TaxID=1434072 RepID=A0A1H2GDG7_9GAMM|nr:flagellar brake protein [Halopseudomonas salegens]SDU17491.1 c-di-GMP-binding flagellar brake protein YcgR, contains PilZNR and PilZ domains [Halopseudomonas salegens]
MTSLFAQSTGPQPPRNIRSSIEICALLKTLQHSRTPLTVHFADRNATFQSFIVDMDSKRHLVWIDEMIPQAGDRYMGQGEPCRLEAWQEGAHLRWEGADAVREMLDDAPAFRMDIPDLLVYHQKRGAFRAPIRRSLEVGIGLRHSKLNTAPRGYLMDISATGCKARVEGNQVNSLPTGEIFDLSHITLPDNGRTSVAVEVRHRQYFSDTDETHVGLMFRDTSPALQRQIDRFVNFLQREARRLERDDLF